MYTNVYMCIYICIYIYTYMGIHNLSWGETELLCWFDAHFKVDLMENTTNIWTGIKTKKHSPAHISNNSTSVPEVSWSTRRWIIHDIPPEQQLRTWENHWTLTGWLFSHNRQRVSALSLFNILSLFLFEVSMANGKCFFQFNYAIGSVA